MMRTALAVATALLLILAEPSCGESGPQPPPPSQPAAPVPNPAPDHAPPGLVKIVLVADWKDRHLVHIRREIVVLIAAVQTNGKIAKYQLEEGGPLLPGPQVLPTLSPWRMDATLSPGISYISWTVTYRYAHQGDIVRCWAELPGKPGVPIPGTVVAKQIIGPYRDATIRLTKIDCIYHKVA